MKTIPGLATLLLALAAAAGNVAADPGHHSGWGEPYAARYGRVLHVKPIYQTVEVSVPEQYCSDGQLAETASNPNRAALAGAVVGGAVGGIAGNQFGKGKGRVVTTVAGTVLGATAGYQFGPMVAGMAPDTQWSYRRCETLDRVETREELAGYRVKYRYRGHVYHTRTESYPGDRIRVDRRARLVHF